ncbi:hypothetical protein P7C70_g7502, partial [Phenoliferia sp. Uapishka_3]
MASQPSQASRASGASSQASRPVATAQSLGPYAFQISSKPKLFTCTVCPDLQATSSHKLGKHNETPSHQGNVQATQEDERRRNREAEEGISRAGVSASSQAEERSAESPPESNMDWEADHPASDSCRPPSPHPSSSQEGSGFPQTTSSTIFAPYQPPPVKSAYQSAIDNIFHPEGAKEVEDMYDWDGIKGGEEREPWINEELLAAEIRKLEGTDDGADFFPFKNKQVFLTSLLRQLPRHHFSDDILKILLAWVKGMGVVSTPALNAIKEVEKSIYKLVGEGQGPKRFEGAHQHVFYLNSLSDIIRRQYANPRIRPHIHHYPRRDAGLHNYCDGTFINHNISQDLAPPMVELPFGNHAYVHEVVLVSSLPNIVIWVQRWYLGAHDRLRGEGCLVDQSGERFTLAEDDNFDFSIDDITHCGSSVKSIDVTQIYLDDEATEPLPSPNPIRTIANGRVVHANSFLIFSDNASENISKKWGINYVYYITNAALHRSAQHLESTIHFIGSSPSALATEMAEEVLRPFNNPSELVEAWDCTTRKDILVLPSVLLKAGDNQMLAEDCSCSVGAASKPCRSCEYGGTKEFKVSPAGFLSLLKPGKPRTPSQTLDTIEQILSLSTQGRISEIAKLQKKTGVRDRLSESISDSFLELQRKLKARRKKTVKPSERGGGKRARREESSDSKREEDFDADDESDDDSEFEGLSDLEDKSKEERDEFFWELLEEAKKKTYRNPFLDKRGLNIHLQSPTEILHTILFGGGKYTCHLTFKDHSAQIADYFIAVFESLNTSGLPAGKKINASYLLRFHGSLVGREFRVLMQTAAIALRPLVGMELMSEELWEVWRALGDLGAVAFVSSVAAEDEEEYLKRLDAVIQHAFLAMAKFRPAQLINGSKWHQLAHAPEDAENFSLLSLLSTEMFEKFNAVLRGAAIHTNKLARSRDVTTTLNRQAVMSHIISGGFFKSEGAYRQAGAGVLSFMESSSLFSRMYGIEGAPKAKPGTCSSPASSNPLPLPPPAIFVELGLTDHRPLTQLFRRAHNFTAISDDKVSDGDFVHVKAKCSKIATSPGLHRVVAILQPTSTPPPSPSKIFQYTFVITEAFKRDKVIHLDYKMAVYRPTSEYFTFVLSDIDTVANVQHDCISQECGIDAVGGVTIEEREETAIRKPSLSHNHPRDDPTKDSFILNSHLIHSYPLLYHLYPRIPRAPAPTNITNTAATFGENLGDGFEEVAEKRAKRPETKKETAAQKKQWAEKVKEHNLLVQKKVNDMLPKRKGAGRAPGRGHNLARAYQRKWREEGGGEQSGSDGGLMTELDGYDDEEEERDEQAEEEQEEEGDLYE